MRFIRTTGFLVLLMLGMAAFVQAAVPKSAGYVTDEARLLTPDQVASLNQALSEYERRTSNQIVVLTVKSLEGQDIASYGIAVAEAWKAGQKKKDNGAIILIAPNDKKVRIEVGYGLEGVLTDAKSAEIIRDIIRPHFREKDFYGGIKDAVTAVEAVIAGEFTAEKKMRKSTQSYFPIMMILLFLAGFIGLTHWTAGAATGSLLAGGLSLFSGIGGIGLIPAIILGLLLGAAAPFLLRLLFDLYGGPMGGGGGFSSFGGGGSSGGDFGGFSGGGGFGGGGASGGW